MNSLSAGAQSPAMQGDANSNNAAVRDERMGNIRLHSDSAVPAA
jgi:hypothetical protein